MLYYMFPGRDLEDNYKSILLSEFQRVPHGINVILFSWSDSWRHMFDFDSHLMSSAEYQRLKEMDNTWV